MFFNKILSICFLSLVLFSCSEHYELPDQPLSAYTKVYMPQAANNPQTYTLKISDTLQEIIYSASFGGQDYPGQDIQVNFSVDNALVDSFNIANNTAYPAMPEKSFGLGSAAATIPKGELSTGPLKLYVKTSGAGAIDILKDYLLPVTISTSSGQINDHLRTTFYKVRAQPNLADYPVMDRSAWTVTDFSSQEANGEGPSNGRAIFALDNNPSTYWHTQWQGGTPGPPHFLTIDMGAVTTLHGLSFLDRQSDNDGKPQDVLVQTSMDNITWTDAAAFTLANTKDLQPQFLAAFREARYFKVIIQSSYNASYTHLAELNAF